MADSKSIEMTSSEVTRNWAKLGIWAGLRRTIRKPSDIQLAARIGVFLVTIPGRMRDTSLSDLLAGLDVSRSRSFREDPHLQVERISRLRQAWLSSPLMSARDTCYIRALTLYRFLDAEDEKQIHFGVESGTDEGDRIHGHAWLTLAGNLLEPPEPVLAGRVRKLYSYPPRDSI